LFDLGCLRPCRIGATCVFPKLLSPLQRRWGANGSLLSKIGGMKQRFLMRNNVSHIKKPLSSVLGRKPHQGPLKQCLATPQTSIAIFGMVC
jgi:hypothetical protein